LGILFSTILCTCPNHRNLLNLIVYYSRFFNTCIKFLYWLISSNFLFPCHILGLKFLYTLSFKKCSVAFSLSLLVSKFLVHILAFYIPFPNPFIIHYPFLPRLIREIRNSIFLLSLGG
jgi:hypothetical protein